VDDVAKITAALLLTLRGTPFIYYGEEIGLPDTKLTRAQIVDPPGKHFWPFYKGRDSARCPLPWNNEPQGGFTTGEPWLPVYEDFPQRNVARQRKNPDTVWAYYHQLLRLRRNTPALRSGIYQSLNNSDKNGMAFLRETDGQQVLIGLNFSAATLKLQLENTLPETEWELALSSHPGSTANMDSSSITLAPYEAAIWVRSSS